MNETELLDLWQSSGDEQLPSAFTVRELAHREPTQRAGAARLPPVSADCATFLAATLEAHRTRTLRRLQLWEFLGADRALDRLQDLMGWSPKGSTTGPVLALSLVALFLVVAAGIAIRPPPQAAPALARDPAAELDLLLAECRTYSNPNAMKPDWPRAAAACQKVLEEAPLHPEANAELQRIAVLQVCEQRLDRAREFLSSGLPESAIEPLGKLGQECEVYLLRAMPLARETMSVVLLRAAKDCKVYSAAGKWDLALARCELYSSLACQGMDPSQLYPPALMTMRLEGPLNPKTQWRPADPLYTAFLRARERLLPAAPTWVCPRLPAFRMYGLASAPPPDPATFARKDLAARYPEPGMGQALVMYFQGDFASAPVTLQKITERLDKAPFHEEARRLLNDMNMAINLYENGVAQITADHPERAEAYFLRALAFDERLVLGARASTLTADEKKRELSRYESFVRKNIVGTMATSTYEKGKALADRKDFRGACRMWKVGAAFSRSNIDLLKALTNVCTNRASELFARAESCEALKGVLDFAVDGDGFKEKITQSLEEQGCP